MDTSRKIGIAIVFGIPAIVGGGVAYSLMGSWTAVTLWEVFLAVILTGTLFIFDNSHKKRKI
nr:hypothetical protein [Desulfobacterales bacterium]